jgi:RNA polymerase sigma factor (sigma-70 family)
MLLQDRIERLGAVAAHLPFALEDYDAANRTFCRWAEHHDDGDLRTLEVWLYCYVHRYVLVRLLRMPHVGGSEADRLVGDVFTHARARFERVADPSRFTHFVCVVCKNAFLNGIRRLYQDVPLDEEEPPAEDAEPTLDESDRALVRHTVDRALEALPEYVRGAARMHLLDGRSYSFIAGATGCPAATVRAYVSRALAHLRNDPGVQALGPLLNGRSP